MSARENPLAGVPGALGRMAILIRRELAAYFVSPGTYVVLTVVFLLQVILFVLGVIGARGDVYQSIRFYFGGLFFYMIMFFLPPVITMRLFSEEKKKGTLEMLMSAPITDLEVVLSKYLSACTVMALVWLPSALLFLVLNAKATGTPDWGPLYGSLIGVGLLSMFLLGVGLFTSVLTEEQVVAAVLAMILNVTYVLVYVLRTLSPDPSQTHDMRLYNPIDQFGQDFSAGIVDSRHIVFYLALTAFTLFGTYKIFEGRRWK